MEKRGYKKRHLWSNGAESLLVKTWKSKINELRSVRQNAHILKDMAKTLQQKGVLCTAHEIKVKMHNMTSRYRKEKAIIEGGADSEWAFYADIEALQDPSNTFHSDALSEDSISENKLSISDSIYADGPVIFAESAASPSAASPSPLPAAQASSNEPAKKFNFQKQLLKKFDHIESEMTKCCNELVNTNSDLREISQQILETERRKTDLLEDFVKNSKKVNQCLIEYLRK